MAYGKSTLTPCQASPPWVEGNAQGPSIDQRIGAFVVQGTQHPSQLFAIGPSARGLLVRLQCRLIGPALDDGELVGVRREGLQYVQTQQAGLAAAVLDIALHQSFIVA